MNFPRYTWRERWARRRSRVLCRMFGHAVLIYEGWVLCTRMGCTWCEQLPDLPA